MMQTATAASSLTVRRGSVRILAMFVFACVCALAPAMSGMAGIQAAADDVSGGWAFVMETPGGTRSMDAMFKVDGKTVTGMWDKKTEVRGTFADNVLDLSFPIETENGAGTLGVKAKLANNELTGSWTFQEYGGSLKATRTAAK
jgi:hypothetical protein